ncbi:GntR family transcriptional regulator [Erysipelothrix sp. Poltava]|nr:GntR family transcriptional regulator [Erysipelothrix sp. Poltava]
MNGTLSVNSQLPTELELSTTYGVSRITSKRALNEFRTRWFDLSCSG